MAFMLGVRVASYCLGGAAVIITHEATKTTTQKLSHWLNANKHNLRHPWRWSRSPDPNPQPEPNHAVGEPDDDDAVNEEPFPCPYHSADSAALITCEPIRVAGPNVPTGAPSVLAAVDEEPDDDAVSEESLPCPYHSADSAALITCEPIRVAGPNVPTGPSVLAAVNEPDESDDDAVNEEPFPCPYHSADSAALTCEPRVAGPNVPTESAATGGDLKEAGSADKPDLVPAAGAVGSVSDRPDDAKPNSGIRVFLLKAVDAVRSTWGMKLFRWLPVDCFCNSSKGAPGDTGWTVDPDFWDKIGRITKKILLWAVEYVILERVKNKKVWRQFYNIVKTEWQYGAKFTTL
uniref:Uncharacterized protein n=1 Tax=Ananas comosus var. bracteatus TaxID=296719 RepID=A0A6V7PEF0_ANACO|nr:unnamed protein product [Ananas comosus var. bracteatus]